MRWTHDVVVIGAGAAGLTAAGGCARLGLRVALIERGRMGGECLNTGCVPSKALLAAGRRAAWMRGDELGISFPGGPRVDWTKVRAHVEAAIAAIAPHDAPERFARWGVEVIGADARLAGPDSVEVAGRVLRAKRIVLAVGSDPAIPPIDGLSATPFLTNETVFRLDACPDHLVILGGGPNGIELAQAFRRLGAAVTVLEPERALAASDREAAAIVLDRLRAEGIAILEGFASIRATRTETGIEVAGRDGRVVAGSHLLVAAGRTPRIGGLGLARARVAHGPDGIAADAKGRTSNRRILAIGDCRSGPRLTHAAGEEGSVAVRRIGFGLPASARRRLLPAVVYTEPEIAQLGLTEQQARSGLRRVTVERVPFGDNDRAVAEGDATGFLKLVRAGGTVLGVTIVGQGAGDLLLPWSLVKAGHVSLWGLAGMTVAYPTRSEISKAAAFGAFEDRVFGRAARRWATLLARLRA